MSIETDGQAQMHEWLEQFIRQMPMALQALPVQVLSWVLMSWNGEGAISGGHVQASVPSAPVHPYTTGCAMTPLSWDASRGTHDSLRGLGTYRV
jgi:hypothetical protein